MPRKPLTDIDIERFRVNFCEAAYALYQQRDYHAVTMRGIAKVLGCSPMMAYRYFENKEHVFAALRATRFDSLAQTLEAVPATRSPLQYLRNLGKAYAGFALDQPHAYRLLYMIPMQTLITYPEVVRAQLRTQNVLFDATRQAVTSGALKGDPIVLAHTLWASIHGLISLNLSNQLNQGLSFETLFTAMQDYALAGK